MPLTDPSSSTGDASEFEVAMDIVSLERAVQSFFSRGLADSSRSSYLFAQKRYLSFCSQFSISPLPVSERSLCLFAAFLANQGLHARTISAYLSAVRHLQISAGLPTPQISSWPWLHYVTRGIKRSQNQSTKVRLPITTSVIKQLGMVWSDRQVCFRQKLLWAVACTAFCGFFRLEELLPLSAKDSNPPMLLSDLATDSHVNTSLFCMTVRKSKTDSFGRGCEIKLRSTGMMICPGPDQALTSYLLSRPVGDGALFLCHDGFPLTKEDFISQVRAALLEAGLNPNLFAGHSFRIGAATTAAAAGVPGHVIKYLGRWSSDAYQL